jgi:hypothetical protein
LRSDHVRTILVDDTLTPDFWPCVDRVSLQLITLLLPLIRLMDRHFPSSPAKSMRSIYQDLHTIVAEAGYLSLGIRWSRDIFRVSFPFPSEVWDMDQENDDNSLFKASEAANERADRAAEAKWKAEHVRRLREQETRANPQTLGEQGEAVLASGLNRLTAVWRRVMGCEGSEDADDGSRPNKVWRQPSRIAKVQIVLWPMLQRFAAMERLDPETGAPDGENVTTIFKSKAVYYHGRTDDNEGPSDHYPSLEDWVRENKRTRMWNLLLPLRWIVYAVGFWLLLSVAAPYSPIIDDVRQILQYGLVGLARYIGREVLLFVLEVMITIIAIATRAIKAVLFLVYALRNTLGRLFEVRPRWIWGSAGRLAEENVASQGPRYAVLSWAWMKGTARRFAATLFGGR